MTDTVTISRELLETIEQTWRVYDKHSPPTSELAEEAICNGLRELRAALAAPRQPEGDAHKHEAQPEVAQNTGSRIMTNKLSSQGCTGCTGVEGVAAPCETPDAVDIFAWATFDGEGSYDLRLYEDNEGYRDDFRDANPLLHPDWVFPLCRLSDAQRAIAELVKALLRCARAHQNANACRASQAGGQGMKPMPLKFVCDICGRKRSHGTKKIDHSKCSKIRQEKHRG